MTSINFSRATTSIKNQIDFLNDQQELLNDSMQRLIESQSALESVFTECKFLGRDCNHSFTFCKTIFLQNVQKFRNQKEWTMPKTLDLLKRALEIKTKSEWARTLNIMPSVFTRAGHEGRLSPGVAGNLAIELGEDAKHWIAIAAIEAEKDSPLLERLKKSQARLQKL